MVQWLQDAAASGRISGHQTATYYAPLGEHRRRTLNAAPSASNAQEQTPTHTFGPIDPAEIDAGARVMRREFWLAMSSEENPIHPALHSMRTGALVPLALASLVLGSRGPLVRFFEVSWCRFDISIGSQRLISCDADP
jgi:hypothetical protein